MKRIIISGGGTGGHIYPAITIYKEIMKQNPDAQVLYVGTERGLEATLVPKEGIEFTTYLYKVCNVNYLLVRW